MAAVGDFIAAVRVGEQKPSLSCRVPRVARRGRYTWIVRKASPCGGVCPTEPVCCYSWLLTFWKSLAAPIADQHLDLLRDRFSFFEYANSHMLAYLVPGELEAIEPGKRRYNWVWYRNAAENRLADLLIDAAGRQRASSIPPGLLSAASETDLRWRHGPSFRPASNAVCSTAKWSPAARSRSSGQIRSVWHPS